MKRWWVLLGLSLVLLALSGCAGARQESWAGAVVADGVLYIADMDHVRALDAETGEELWSWMPGTRANAATTGFYARPTYDAERKLLLVATLHGQEVYALQLTDNTRAVPGVAWVYPREKGSTIPLIGPLLQALGALPEAEGAKGQYVAGGAIGGDLFVIGNGDGSVYALNLADGTLAWRFATRERIWTTPLIVEDTVYVASMDHGLYALALADGALKWKFEGRGAFGGAPVLVDGGLWIGDFGDRVYRLDPETGAVLWTFEEGENWFWSTGTPGAGRITFADVGGNVITFDTRTPSVIWQQRVEGEIFRGQGVLSSDGKTLYLPGYQSGVIRALEAATGSILPQISVAQGARLPGDLTTDGERIYVMPIMAATRVQALDAEDGKLLWQYPLPE